MTAHAGRYQARERDWRRGAVVYQVLVDRFAPSAALDAKRALYAPPKTLRDWSEAPRRGAFLPEHQLWSHELDFWGGDLASLASRLDHVQQLGAEVLYLNPIFHACTNHKYDTVDYEAVSPEFGTRAEVVQLATELHRRGMRLVLDGVFNHMGRQAPRFQQALAAARAAGGAAPPERDWFVFGPQYPGGARCWFGAANLPELNLDNPAVREHLYAGADSVVRRWLRDGADGWRLDVAYDLGFELLGQLTRAAHAEKAQALVVGEIPNYPAEWVHAVDGVMLFGVRRLLLNLAAGEIDAPTAGRMITRLIDDAGIDALLASWLLLDNHDTPRLATVLPDERRRRVAQVLQFTLPGAPNLYYGSEVGMTGGDDPEMRAPMRWDRVDAGHPQLAWTRELAGLRRQRALRVGDYRPLIARDLFAFERHTDRVLESVFVVANPGEREVTELLQFPNPRLMDGTRLVDLLDQADPVTVRAALARVRVPAHSVLVLRPELERSDGYDPYKRVP